MEARRLVGVKVALVALVPTQPPNKSKNHDPSVIGPTGRDPRNAKVKLSQLPAMGVGVLAASGGKIITATAAASVGGLLAAATDHVISASFVDLGIGIQLFVVDL